MFHVLVNFWQLYFYILTFISFSPLYVTNLRKVKSYTYFFVCTEVPLGTPHFGGDGYLLVDIKHSVSKRGGGVLLATEPVIDYIFLNFSTAQHDGMIIWTSQVNLITILLFVCQINTKMRNYSI